MAHMRNTTDSDGAAPEPALPAGPQAQSVGEEPALLQDSPDGWEAPSEPAPTPRPRGTGRWQRRLRRVSREHRAMALALLLSLGFHALLLSLKFGGDVLGLPGLAVPWLERRTEVPDLRVVLVPAPARAAEPAVKPDAKLPPRATIKAPVAARTTPALPVPPAPRPRPTAVANAPAAEPAAQADAAPAAVAAPAPAPVEAPAPAQEPDRALTEQTAEPAGVEVQPVDAPAPVVLATPVSPSPVIAAAPSASSPPPGPPASPDPGDAAREAQREEVARQEAARVEAARLETERQNAAQEARAQQEAQRQEAARQEAARVEAVRLEAERQTAARQVAAGLEAQREEAARRESARVEAAARQEAQREEAARQEATRAEAARLEAERQNAARQAADRLEAQQREATRQEAARVEAARQAAARQEAARVEAAQEETAKREAVLRAIGRQLDAEAAQRDAAAKAAPQANTLPLSLSTARRVRLWGRSDPNVELVQYAEAWARKIQFNTAVDTVRELAKRPHTQPLVTVAVRSDGSVESVTFVVTSGVAEVDETIRRIIESHAPYPVFQPALARQFDVIEIRRTWSFDSAIRLQ